MISVLQCLADRGSRCNFAEQLFAETQKADSALSATRLGYNELSCNNVYTLLAACTLSQLQATCILFMHLTHMDLPCNSSVVAGRLRLILQSMLHKSACSHTAQ